MDWMGLAIQLISGALGGNVIGTLLKKLSLGFVGNSLTGLVGGLGGGWLLDLFLNPGVDGAAPAMGDYITDIAGGAGGGGILMVIVGLLKNMMSK